MEQFCVNNISLYINFVTYKTENIVKSAAANTTYSDSHHAQPIWTRPAPYGSRGCNAPRFICCLQHYGMFACLLKFSTHFSLAYWLSHLSTSLRIGPFHFHAGCRKRRLKLFCCVNFMLSYVLLCLHVWFGCLDLVFICNGLVCIFVFFCVRLDHFGFVFDNFVLLGLVFFQYRAKRLARKNFSEMNYFVSSGT